MTSTTNDFRIRLVNFYTVHAPDKLAGVDDLLQKSKGKEEKLFDKLKQKYECEEPSEEEVKKAMAGSGAKSRSKNAPRAASKSPPTKQQQQQTKAPPPQQLQQQQDDEDDEEDNDGPEYGSREWWKQRMEMFYKSKGLNDKLSGVDGLLDKAGGDVRKLEKLMNMLVEKYGPEPESEDDEEEKPPAVSQPSSSGIVAEDSADEDEDGVEYGSREWWKRRVERFYSRYAEDKLSTVDGLLDKAQGDPAKLDKLIHMLETKYGPEPSSSEDEEDKRHAADVEDEEEEQQQQIDEWNPKSRTREPKVEAKKITLDDLIPPGLNKIMYCPLNGLPAEYCEYQKDTFEATLPWLLLHFPTLRLTSIPDTPTVQEHCAKLGVTALKAGEEIKPVDLTRKRGDKKGGGGGADAASGAAATARVYVEMIARSKKKSVTIVKGLEVVVQGMKLKDAAKVMGKKFASGASVKTTPQGEEVIEIQGDVADEVPMYLVEQFKVSKSVIWSVDEDGKKSKAFD